MTNLKAFKGKKVIITGDTGFKGAWLSIWLAHLGAHVYGMSMDIPTQPSLYEVIHLNQKVEHRWGDIRDLNDCKNLISDVLPDFIFHLAAQPIVLDSYKYPHTTFMTNALGTLNILEALRLHENKCVAIMITSDKCYENIEQIWGYRENDRLGGKDPYSASKAAAELILRSYSESFFDEQSQIRIGVCRAGNVIGGGDWAVGRIVPDAIRSWSKNEKLIIRNPFATRPWQHVLEPLSGYLTLATNLVTNMDLSGEAFNFGPTSDQSFSVQMLLKLISKHWGFGEYVVVSGSSEAYEAGLLKLNCDKANQKLHWTSILSFEQATKFTAEWYKNYYFRSRDPYELTLEQIITYENLAKEREQLWAI